MGLRMSGRPASLLLALSLPAILSATCNPKKTQPGATDASPVKAGAEPVAPIESTDRAVQACPGLEAAAGPLGPAVAPACPGGAAAPDPALEKSLGKIAAVHAEAFAPMGPAVAVEVKDAPALLRSAVLQGPPHCYVLVALCQDDEAARLRIEAAGATGPLVEAGGPALSFCPTVTGSYDVSVTVEKPPATCAARLYGD